MTPKQTLIVLKASGLLTLLAQGIVPPNIAKQAAELVDEIGEHFGDAAQMDADRVVVDPERTRT